MTDENYTREEELRRRRMGGGGYRPLPRDDAADPVRKNPTADLSIGPVVNGMGEPDTSGAYVQMTISPKGCPDIRVRVSIGACEIAAAELIGLMDGKSADPVRAENARLREVLNNTKAALQWIEPDGQPYVRHSYMPDGHTRIVDYIAAALEPTP
jgi:hypothetical protein